MKHLPIMNRYTIVAGTGESKYKLNAFDNALLNAGVGDLNLLRVSSILPPDCHYSEEVNVSPGSLLPIAYGSITSDNPGELISAAVAIGKSKTYGVIMEHSQIGPAKKTEKIVEEMVKLAFRKRNLSLKGIMLKSIEYKIEQAGCAFAAVAMWGE